MLCVIRSEGNLVDSKALLFPSRSPLFVILIHPCAISAISLIICLVAISAAVSQPGIGLPIANLLWVNNVKSSKFLVFENTSSVCFPIVPSTIVSDPVSVLWAKSFNDDFLLSKPVRWRKFDIRANTSRFSSSKLSLGGIPIVKVLRSGNMLGATRCSWSVCPRNKVVVCRWSNRQECLFVRRATLSACQSHPLRDGRFRGH